MRISLLVLLACKSSDPAPIAEKPAPIADRSSLDKLPVADLVGYFSGAYHTSSNNPGVYYDASKHVIAMSGRSGSAELPSTTKPEEVRDALEVFFLANDYEINGKKPTDKHQKVMVNGKEMVVMPMTELFPEMPADLKAHFTSEQYDLLYKTASTDGYGIVAKKYPVMFAYLGAIEVRLPDGSKSVFDLQKANDAFALFQQQVH